MSLLHRRWRMRVSLLASGALEGPEQEAALRHVETCQGCRQELVRLRAVLACIAADPVRDAEPAVPLAALVTRVEARLSDRSRPAPLVRSRPLWAAAAAATVAVAVLYLRGHVPSPMPPMPASPPVVASVPEDVLRRLEGGLAREQAVRYLNDAQDVLVTVAAATRNCDRTSGRVDVGQEARRSRELLARRALLLEIEGDGVASARPVLEDVEAMLREVASLEACARSRDLELLHREIARRRLLMKIDLMTQELQG